jgi:hypothetical protein
MKDEESFPTPKDWWRLLYIVFIIGCLWDAFGVVGASGLMGLATIICQNIRQSKNPKE